MSIIAIIINFFIEYKGFSTSIKKWFSGRITAYANLFMKKEFQTVRQIRLNFIIAMIPFAVATIILKSLHLNHLSWLYPVENGILYILCVDMLGWKNEAKQANRKNTYQSFVQSYATNFFATTIWFILLPSVLGSICYLTLTAMANILRQRSSDSAVYAMVIDKMLFWINVLPYTLLITLIAITGDFESVMHHMLTQKNKIKVSYLYLENLLNDVAYIAIGKDKFRNNRNYHNEDGFEVIERKNVYDPQIVDYIVALLYRSGAFFILGIAALFIAEFF